MSAPVGNPAGARAAGPARALGATGSPVEPPAERTLRALAMLALSVLLAGALTGCASDTSAPTDGDEDPQPAEARTYAMGWTPNPPRASDELFLATVDSAARVSEVTILQQPVPWARLLAGASMEDLVAERVELAGFLRTKGFEIVFLVDPLDGLDRTKETPELVETGRSLLEPEIRGLHADWVRAVAREVRPAWFGLASEINTLAARGDTALYRVVKGLVNDLAPEVRSLAPGSRVFVSFQVEDAWNLFELPSRVDAFELLDDFDVDAIGLSSYPGFAYASPDEIPDDHLARFDAATGLPLLFVEGGWSSADVGSARGTPQEQSAFFARYEELLDGVDARLWVGLTFADLDLGALDLPPEREAGLASFSRMGIVDTELRPKPAHAVWERIFARPLERP